MNKFIYILYALLSLMLVVLCAIGEIPLLWGLAFLWLPLVIVLTALFCLALLTDISVFVRRKQEAKNPPTCQNCLYKQVQMLLNQEQCMGEKTGNPVVNGKCPLHKFKE